MKTICTFFILTVFSSFAIAQEVPTLAETDSATEVAVQESDLDTQDSASDLGTQPEPEAESAAMDAMPMPLEAGSVIADPAMGCCGGGTMNAMPMAGCGCSAGHIHMSVSNCCNCQPTCCQPTCCNYQPVCQPCCNDSYCRTTCRTRCCKVRIRRCRIFRRCR